MISLPLPVDRLALEMRDGARIVVLRHGNAQGPRLVLSHGNGLASDAYFPFWRLALEHYEVVLFDFRNHGRNPFVAGLDHGYKAFLGDLDEVHRAIAARWGAKTTIGAFHSMSALASLRAAVDGNWHWQALVLFDPPVMPPPGHPSFEEMVRDGRQISEMVAKRVERFADPADLAQAYARRFPGWVPGAAELLARAVLRRDDAAGDWVLACPAALESTMYLANRTLHMWPRADELTRPAILIGADPAGSHADSVARSGAALHHDGGIRYATIPDTSHFLQFESPEACYRVMRDFLVDVGLET